jgi:hypothetical protein
VHPVARLSAATASAVAHARRVSVLHVTGDMVNEIYHALAPVTEERTTAIRTLAARLKPWWLRREGTDHGAVGGLVPPRADADPRVAKARYDVAVGDPKPVPSSKMGPDKWETRSRPQAP